MRAALAALLHVVTLLGSGGAAATPLREVRLGADARARADYLATRAGMAGRVLPDHEAAGWRQRSRLLPDGRTAVTVVVLPRDPLPAAAWPRGRALPPEVAAFLPVEPAHPEIAALAGEIVHGLATQAQVSERVLTWVSANVAHEDDPGHADDALAALASGRASCVGRSLLARDLLRAAGIPARTVHGLLAGERGGFLLHKYVESWIEGAGWVPSDPGRSVHVVDEQHLVLAFDDRPYDPEAQRGLHLRVAGEPERLRHDGPADGLRPLLVRETESQQP